jgi:hypothetical protein
VKPWDCLACTSINEPLALACGTCQTEKGKGFDATGFDDFEDEEMWACAVPVSLYSTYDLVVLVCREPGLYGRLPGMYDGKGGKESGR